jgi:hypothetical protein
MQMSETVIQSIMDSKFYVVYKYESSNEFENEVDITIFLFFVFVARVNKWKILILM